MKRINLLLWVIALSVPLSAQNPTSAQSDAMKKLDFLVGQWKGEGWISFGPGQRRTFTQTETVEPKLGGLLLVVDGLGKSKDAANEGAVVHNAFAVVSYDDKTKQVRWHAYTAEGVYVDTELKSVQERTLQWSILSPGRSIRFTMSFIEKDRWLEVGEFSQDGKSWLKFFDMTLQRVK